MGAYQSGAQTFFSDDWYGTPKGLQPTLRGGREKPQPPVDTRDDTSGGRPGDPGDTLEGVTTGQSTTPTGDVGTCDVPGLTEIVTPPVPVYDPQVDDDSRPECEMLIGDCYTAPYLSDGKFQASVPFGKTKPTHKRSYLSRLHDTAWAVYPDRAHRRAADYLYHMALKNDGWFSKIAANAVLRFNDLSWLLGTAPVKVSSKDIMDILKLYERDPYLSAAKVPRKTRIIDRKASKVDNKRDSSRDDVHVQMRKRPRSLMSMLKRRNKKRRQKVKGKGGRKVIKKNKKNK